MNEKLKIYQIVLTNPGVTCAELAKLADVPPGSIDARLASLEKIGLLMYQEDDGRLFVYEEGDGAHVDFSGPNVI